MSRDGSTSRKDLVIGTVVMKSVGLEVAKSYFWDDCPRMARSLSGVAKSEC